MAQKKTRRNDGKKFEKHVASSIKKLYPAFKVEEDVKRLGIISGGKRQIDALMHGRDGLVDFEAKDYKRNVGIDAVAAYAFKVADEDVPQGVMISKGPYAKTAIKTAKNQNVKLAHLVDTSDKTSRIRIAQRVLIEDVAVQAMGLGLRHSGPGPFSIPSVDPLELVLIDEKGVEVTAYKAFQSMWNGNKIPSAIGENSAVIDNQKVKMADGQIGEVQFTFRYIVEVIYRYGEVPAQEATGIYNVLEGSFSTNRNYTSGVLSVEEINKWPRVSEDELKNISFGMKLSVRSMLPDNPPSREDHSE